MKKKIIFFSAIIFSLYSCKTPPETDNLLKTKSQEIQTLSLLFLGDIMAHAENFKMQDFNKIWTEVKPIFSKCDFVFGNIESPVDDRRPFSSYPEFNMKNSYPKAMIDAGINVFSLANNHTNDQKIDGILQTFLWAETNENSNKIYFSGIKNIPNSEITYKIIEYNSWRIIFCAITEILNQNIGKEYINFVNYTEQGRNDFIKTVNNIRHLNESDIFILSIHSNETEYVKDVKESRKKYYHSLLENGVDVIWANHPHIVRERELIGDKNSKKIKKIILYGNGNTISGQRRNPQFKNPENSRDNTGDSLMFFADFSKDLQTGETYISRTKPYYITTYINTAWNFVIKNLDEDFINYLEENNRSDWKEYIKKRKEITEQTKETIIWQ
ncbi:MAG: CapA family protein [Treponema sp.]|nr:CapA family protein [Treponema sp.]